MKKKTKKIISILIVSFIILSFTTSAVYAEPTDNEITEEAKKNTKNNENNNEAISESTDEEGVVTLEEELKEPVVINPLVPVEENELKVKFHINPKEKDTGYYYIVYERSDRESNLIAELDLSKEDNCEVSVSAGIFDLLEVISPSEEYTIYAPKTLNITQDTTIELMYEESAGEEYAKRGEQLQERLDETKGSASAPEITYNEKTEDKSVFNDVNKFPITIILYALGSILGIILILLIIKVCRHSS